jgi:hypothetical protein
VSVSAHRPQLDAAEEERPGKLVIAAASRIAGRLIGPPDLHVIIDSRFR